MDTMTTMTKWQDQYFTMVKKVEEPVLKFAGEMADRVEKVWIDTEARAAARASDHAPVVVDLLPSTRRR